MKKKTQLKRKVKKIHNPKTKTYLRVKQRSTKSRKKQSKKKIRKERKTINSFNIGKLMRKYAPGMYVSPSAVEAMKDRIDMFLETAMPEIAKIAKADGYQKYIKESEDLVSPEKSHAHITQYFGIIGNDIEQKIMNNGR